MVFNFDRAEYLEKQDGLWLMIRVDKRQRLPLFKWVSKINEKKRKYTATFKEKKDKRSLDANSLFWAGVTAISDATHIPMDDVYIQLIIEYGVRTPIIVKPKAAKQMMRTFRYCENLGEVMVNGNKGVQLMAYIGSSKYDTKQMSRLIDGMMYEIKGLGIDFASPEEIARCKAEWGT